MSNAQPTLAARNKFSPRRALLFASPFILMGALSLGLALYGVFSRQLDVQTGKHLLTIIVVCTGTAMCIIGWFATKRPKPGQFLKANHPEKPWMWREDWMAGRVDNSVIRSIFFLWLSVIVFDFVCLLALALVLRGIQYGNQAAWLALLFPVTGLVVTGFAWHTARVWGIFGRSTLAMADSPLAPGKLLQGEIRAPRRIAPEHAFYLRMSCTRRTTVLRGKVQVTTERILWQEEKWFRPNLPQSEPGATHLPVFFKLPADLPESTFTSGDGVQWLLEAQAKISGPDFHAIFEVPVCKSAAVSAGADVPAVAAEPADPTLPQQLTLDEIRKEIRSQIAVMETANGREFIFPAGRTPIFAAGATALWLIWTGAVILMVVKHAPPLFPLIFAALDLLMSVFMFDLWLRRTRVVVTPAEVTIQTSWITLKKEAVIPAAKILGFKADIGATAGHAAYYDLKLKTRTGKEYVAAKNLSHKPEAEWLLRQMIAVLKQPKAVAEAEAEKL